MKRIALLLAALTALSSNLHAAGIDISFESGDFTGWKRYGKTEIVDATFGHNPVGTYSALITADSGASSATGLVDFFGANGIDISYYLSYAPFANGFASGIISEDQVYLAPGDELSMRVQGFTNDQAVVGFTHGGAAVFNFGGGSTGDANLFSASSTMYAYETGAGMTGVIFGGTTGWVNVGFFAWVENPSLAGAGYAIAVDNWFPLVAPQNVPDASSSLSLLSLGLIATGVIRRRQCARA